MEDKIVNILEAIANVLEDVSSEIYSDNGVFVDIQPVWTAINGLHEDQKEQQ